MSRYIGLDVHAKSCTLAVVGPSGRRLGSQVVETHGAALLSAIRAVARPRHLCLEEGTQSAWLYEVLGPHVDEIVVTQSRGQRGQKNDERDAFTLADGLRIGALDRIVYKDPRSYGTLRSLAHTYVKVRSDVVRTKNRIKSIYRGRGIATMVLERLFELTADDARRGYTLEVRVSNATAISLYERLGFEARGIRRGYYTDNREDALIMWKDPFARERA